MVGFLTALVLAIVLTSMMAYDGEAAAAIVLVVGPMIGVVYGLLAGLVHGVSQLPLAAVRARRIVLPGSDESLRNPATAVFAPYVLLTPFLAARRRYDVASTDAAESAARRNGASTASRSDGSASDTSRATSE